MPSAPKLRDIQLFIYDFDGVMTDNRVLVSDDGKESVFCNRGDGMAVGQFRKAGVHQFILSTEPNPVVSRRAAKLSIPCIQNCPDKRAALEKYAQENPGTDFSRALYVGNDTNDFEAMSLCGMKVAPADAHSSIRAIADLVTQAKGGEGVIRELYDHYLKSVQESGRSRENS